jgi:hypothetical protein
MSSTGLRRPLAYLGLSLVFLAPALVKLSNLVDAGRLRWVEGLTLFVGGLAGGALMTRAAHAWRDRHQ